MRNLAPLYLLAPGLRSGLKRFFCAVLSLITCGLAWADGEVRAEDLRAVYSKLIVEIDHNFVLYRGEKVAADQSGVYFRAKPPVGMVPGSQNIALINGSYYYIADITAPAGIKDAREAFFSMPNFDSKGAFTIGANPDATNAEKTVSNLLLNGRKIGTYAKYHGDKEDILTIGPFVNHTAEMNDEGNAQAGTAARTIDLRAVFSGLITESDHNFETYQGEKAAEDSSGTYFRSKPIPGMVAGAQYVALLKGYYFYIADITAAPSLRSSREAFFAMQGFQDGKGTYVVEADKAKSSEQKEVTNLLLNGNKVATYTKYQGGTEDVITIGPFGGRPAGEKQVPALDAKTKSFTAGVQILVRAAAGDFSGMVGNLIRKTGDGDLLYVAARVPEMQTEDDAQVLMFTENRYFYMNSYDNEADVAFALASFLALPNNITLDHGYTVEIDSRLNGATSMTYHLRYNGEIVGDFVKFKTKPKAYVSFGYRDGIPKGLAMSKTYSNEAIEGAKQMINAATTCANCRGTGVEEIDTGWESKSSGIHEKKWVPCHYCHGTGHL